MPGLPDTKAGLVLDSITLRGTGTSYLALLTTDPGADPTVATLPEIVTAGYARQQVVWTAPTGSPPVTQNNALVTFGPFTADMTDAATYVALVDAQTGTTGNVEWVWQLDQSVAAVTNEVIQFAAGTLTLTPASASSGLTS